MAAPINSDDRPKTNQKLVPDFRSKTGIGDQELVSIL